MVVNDLGLSQLTPPGSSLKSNLATKVSPILGSPSLGSRL